MPKHIVAQGECLTSIAFKYGFSDYKTIYNDPGNAPLRTKRPDPNLLFPGDEIVIPDIKPNPKSLDTGASHKFVVKTPQRKLKIKLQSSPDEALGNAPYRLLVGGQPFEGQTDGDGVLEQLIPANAMEGWLHLGATVVQLRIGALNPMENTPDDGVSGVQARLTNLGYDVGPADGALGPRTEAAIAAFQKANDLEPTGKIDGDLRDALKKAYGC
jgi:N-acetylmuramoyl-L-alanine amidase